jgi:hypothetical protein
MIWLIVSLLFTLMIFSYLLGDNLFFRLTSYIFIGITAGYVAVLVFYQVVLGRLVWPFIVGTNEQKAFLAIPVLLSALLFLKLGSGRNSIGNIPLGFLAGAGAAVIAGGALFGTITPQTAAAVEAFTLQPGDNLLYRWLEAGFLLIGTITTLAYFHFGSGRRRNTENRPGWVEPVAAVGKVFIGFTLGALFVGVYSAAITSLIDRLGFIWDAIGQIILNLL